MSAPLLLLHDHAAAVAFYASVLSAPVVEVATRVRGARACAGAGQHQPHWSHQPHL